MYLNFNTDFRSIPMPNITTYKVLAFILLSLSNLTAFSQTHSCKLAEKVIQAKLKFINVNEYEIIDNGDSLYSLYKDAIQNRFKNQISSISIIKCHNFELPIRELKFQTEQYSRKMISRPLNITYKNKKYILFLLKFEYDMNKYNLMFEEKTSDFQILIAKHSVFGRIKTKTKFFLSVDKQQIQKKAENE